RNPRRRPRSGRPRGSRARVPDRPGAVPVGRGGRRPNGPGVVLGPDGRPAAGCVRCRGRGPSATGRRGGPVDRGEHRRLIVETLQASDLPAEPVGEDRWMTMLAGEWKRTIPVLFDLDERSLRVSSLFCGAPDEGHAEVYELVLHRNERLTWV